MNIVVQHLESKLYLTRDGDWVRANAEPAAFLNAVQAISFCIQQGIRSVRLVTNAGSSESERYFYPFGADPAIKAARKQLRRSLAEHRRLARQKRMLLARLDALQAEAKERKKQIPFKRKPVGEE